MVNGGQGWSRGDNAFQGFPMGVQFCRFGSRGVIGGQESWIFYCRGSGEEFCQFQDNS